MLSQIDINYCEGVFFQSEQRIQRALLVENSGNLAPESVAEIGIDIDYHFLEQQ